MYLIRDPIEGWDYETSSSDSGKGPETRRTYLSHMRSRKDWIQELPLFTMMLSCMAIRTDPVSCRYDLPFVLSKPTPKSFFVILFHEKEIRNGSGEGSSTKTEESCAHTTKSVGSSYTFRSFVNKGGRKLLLVLRRRCSVRSASTYLDKNVVKRLRVVNIKHALL